jgi:Twin arginine targeting (Tat) protein translocase TatC
MSAEDTFISHLIELRSRLLRCIYVFVPIFFALVYFAGDLYDLLAHPMMQALPQGSKMIATGVVAPFFIPMKVAAMVAFLVALPYLLYQAWAFVAPGLYAHEKRFVLPLIISSTLLFFIGMAFCYFFVFKGVFAFIAKFAPASITVAPDIENYFNFVLGMFLAFGLAFETPVVVVVLVRTGIVSIETLQKIRRYVIVGAFVVAAVATPPDVASQLSLAIPLCLLYELGILFARFIGRVPPRPAPTET